MENVGGTKEWSGIERSLACAAEAKRLRARAHHLQEASKRLRRQSAALLRSHAFRVNRSRKDLTLVDKLRLSEEPVVGE